jgi:hypothetical protein
MKNILLILFILLLAGCTREYYMVVYVQPEKKDVLWEPGAYINDAYINDRISIDDINRIAPQSDSIVFGRLKLRPGGAVHVPDSLFGFRTQE